MPWTAPRDDLNNHQSIWLTLVARLKPGVSRVQAESSLGPLWHSLRAYELTLYKGKSEHFKQQFLDQSHLKVFDDSTGFSPGREDLQKPLVILMSMAGLLVALCAINVATLLLLRAVGRAREMSMRYALGAKRSHIVAQLLVEGGLLGVAGGGVGLALSSVAARILMRLMTAADPGSEPYSTSVDTHVLLFTLVVSISAALLFSIAPVVHFIRPNLAETLRQNAGTASKASQRFRKLAVGVQIALSVLLLGGAGLFVRTLENLRHQPVGFQTSNLLTFALDPSNSGYGEARTSQIVVEAAQRLAAIPGVSSVAANTDPELTGDSNGSNFTLSGYHPAEEERMVMETPWITPGYFATLKQPLLLGQEFTAADAKGQPKVAIVNLALAKRFFGSAQNAMGRMITEGDGNVKLNTTIVGVVGDAKHVDLRSEISPTVYRPYIQQEHPGGVVFYLRAAQAPDVVESAIRRTMQQLDATLVVDSLRTMEEQVDRSASDERTLAFLAIGFSSLALLMAAVGLYGVLAYSTEQRTREIGVRLALGAQRSSVMILIVREMVVIAGIATAVALPSVVALARLFSSQLYGVKTFDPFTLAAAAGLTVLMLALASALPARRAASIEPTRALRSE